MFSKKIEIHLEKKDDLIQLEPLSDIHVGHRGFDIDLYERRINKISKERDRYTFFGGDLIDAITPWDKRFNPEMTTETSVDAQRQTWQHITQPLFDAHKKSKNPKIWGLFHGNHEYNIRQIDRPYIENNMCIPNGIDFLGSRGIFGLYVFYKKNLLANWSILFQHGSGGGTNAESPLQNMKMNHYCDVFLMGHLHQKRYFEEQVLEFDFYKGEVVERSIALGNTGTFCKTLVNSVDGYMDRKNKVIPAQPGTITIQFDPLGGKINGHV